MGGGGIGGRWGEWREGGAWGGGRLFGRSGHAGIGTWKTAIRRLPAVESGAPVNGSLPNWRTHTAER